MKMTIGKSDRDVVTLDPLALVDTRALIQANSGGGKSYLLRLIAEQAAGKLQTIVLDPEGEFATLRERCDLLLVGESGEVAADPASAALLARKLCELRVSAVLDIYGLRLDQRRAFVRRFCESLLDVPRALWHPLLVLIDEAHLYCPERSAGDAESTAAIIGLMSQGRKRGFCGVLATQRLSKLHKDAAAEANNVFIGRTWLDVDQHRAGDLLGFDKSRRTELRDLSPGCFHAFGPALSFAGVRVFQANRAVTTHPKPGERHKIESPQASAAIRKHLPELEDLASKARTEIRDLEAAKAEIAQLRRSLSAKPAAVSVTDDAAIGRAVLARERQLTAEFRTVETGLRKVVTQYGTRLKRIAEIAASNGVHVPEARTLLAQAERVPRVVTPAIQRRRESDSADTSGLTGPERRILNALAWLESVGNAEPEQTAVAFLAGYTYGGGAFNNPKGALRGRGLIEYASADRMRLTDAGRELADAPDADLTSAEMHRRVLERLPGPERRIMAVLIEAHPEAVPFDELARRAGYEPRGGAFNNPRGRLRSLGLIEYASGAAKARDVLFLEATR